MNLPITTSQKGRLTGRVLGEALLGGKEMDVARHQMTSVPAANGRQTILHYQQVGTARYFDVAGFAGRTIGMDINGHANHLSE